MAKATATVTPGTMTDANFQLIVSTFETVFAAGMVRTADAGQINPATVVRATVTPFVAGFSIFRFNDTLQATAPVFIKFEYGQLTAAGYIQVWITIGTGSDGAGNLTGIISARQPVSGQVATSNGSNVPLYVSAKSNWCCADLQYTVNQRFAFGIERSRGIDGSSNANGVNFIWFYYDSNQTASLQFRSKFCPFETNNAPPTETAPSTNPPTQHTSGLAADGSTAIYPLCCFDIGEPLPHVKLFVGVFWANINQGAIYPVDVYGATQNMIGGMNQANLVLPIISNYSYLMRYED